MADLVDPSEIETIVGTERQAYHVGRAISTEERFYILHSQECFDLTPDLRECPFSKALDANGIDEALWADRMDEPVPIKLVNGRRESWYDNPEWVVPADEGR